MSNAHSDDTAGAGSADATESITVYSDYVCPFCYLGRRSLDEYLETREEPLAIDWHPFDLRAGKRNPDESIEDDVDDGKGDDYYEQARENVRRLQEKYDVEMAQELRTDVDSLPAQIVSVHVRETAPEAWRDFDDAVFAALWQDGRDIGDRDVLFDLARDVEGLDADVVGKVLEERITLAPGASTLVATMRAAGARCVLVSGGFTAFTARVAEMLGFDENRANTLLAEGGLLTGKVAQPILGRDAKVQALKEISAQLGISEQDVIAVGDGANDLGMLSRAGAGVALHAKPSVAAECDIRINHGDLTALLYLQGYARSEFAEG